MKVSMMERFIGFGFTLVGAVLIGLSQPTPFSRFFCRFYSFCTDGGENKLLGRNRTRTLEKRWLLRRIGGGVFLAFRRLILMHAPLVSDFVPSERKRLL